MVRLEQSAHWKNNLIAIGIFFLVVVLRFSHLIKDLNSIMFHAYGDGIKNYFTPSYYVAFDQGWKFTGMNYPYGEVLTFTDNQPILSICLNFIDDHLFSISSHMVGIINGLMILSFVLCAFFTYLILRHFKVPMWIAIWGGIILAFLSPQVDRMAVHFALGYSFFIPLSFWLTLQAVSKSKSNLWALSLAIVIFLQSLIHVYFLMINGLMIGTFFLAQWIVAWLHKTEFNKKHWYLLGSLTLGAIGALLVIKGFDPIEDRPDSPWGINNYTANLQSLLFPTKGVLNEWLKPSHIEFEAQAHIGLTSSVIFILILGLGIYRRLTQRSVTFLSISDKGLWWATILTGFISFCYATGWLNAIGLKYVNEIVTPLKQFRSLGRLAWIAYFTFVLSGLIALSGIYQASKSGILSKSWRWISVLLLLTWTMEAHFHSTGITKNFHNPNFFDEAKEYAQLFEQHNIGTNKYQAILSVPITVLGPEKVQIQKGHSAMREAMNVSLATGLPIVDIMMSRTSIHQGMNFVELLSPQYVPKSRLDAMDDRPILGISSTEIFSPTEERLLLRGKVLFEARGYRFWELEREDFYSESALPVDSTITEPYLHFDYNEDVGEGFAGEGGHKVEEDYQIWMGSVPEAKIYEASFWIKVDNKRNWLPHIRFSKYNAKGKLEWEGNYDYFREYSAQNDWLRIFWRFDGIPNSDIFKIEYVGEGYLIDEFQIKIQGSHTAQRSGQDLLIDNYLINAEK